MRGGLVAGDVRRARGQRNFLRDYDTMLKALMLDYVDCARYETSGYADFIGKLYTLNGAMFQSPVFCDHTLTQMMLHYLAWFQDPALRLVVGDGAAWHMREDCRVQRWGDELWVVAARPGAPVQAGERIVRVNGMALDEIRPEVERTLGTTVEPADPEREDWSCVLAFAKRLAVVGRDGAERSVHVVPGESAVAERMRARYAREDGAERPAGEKPAADGGCGTEAVAPAGDGSPAGAVPGAAVSWAVRDGAAVVCLARAGCDGFAAALAGALAELGRACAAGGVRGVVLDVRGCRGGAQEDVYPLVPYVLAAGSAARPAEVFGRPGIVLNCSRHNVDAKLAELAAVRARLAGEGGAPRTDEDAAAVAELDALVADLTAKRGAGLVADETDYYPDARFAAAPELEALARRGGRVVVLADRYTGEAAEWLAKAAKAVGAATVAGRATAGSIDNTCPRVVRLDEDFSLVVPTAKYLAACGEGATLGRGVAPDVHVAWTPEQLERDVELERACAIACGR